MGSALSSFSSLMGSVLSSCCSPSLLSLPPSPPPPPTRPEIKYDVFLSFRGEDTRNTFISHLLKALRGKGLDVFIDYQLRRGDEISPSLLQAIEESLISIVIFSKNYADSRWCLEELVKILECKRNHGQIVIPVFYEIDPSHVRNQTGSYAVAFVGHKKRFKEDLNKVQTWRCALKEAANLSGSDSRVLKPESELVESIVEDVLKWLNSMPQCDNQDLIGIDSSIEEVEAMLRRGSVGIWGIGGIGKTTLARALYEKISCQFDRFYFADSVREASKQDFGLNYLRQRLFSTLLGDENACIATFRNRSQRLKFLIVLDDVSDYVQVNSLIGDPWCLDSKCQIIITSRDKQVLRNCCMDDNIYMVKELCFHDALKLFCRNAFRPNRPNVNYKELSNSVVKMVGGVPLALTVLGSSMLDKEKEVWKSIMKKLEKIFDKRIQNVLKISYEELDDVQQNIFLDIACFFKGWDIVLVRAFMKACGFFPVDGIVVLIDKSLITISENRLRMHDLLQAMGKEIVRQESISDPGERSRLWHHKDIYDVLTKGKGTDRLEGISLNMSKSEDINLRAFANMPHLRFLDFYTSHTYWSLHTPDRHCVNRVHIAEGPEFYFTQLSYLRWHGCPLKSLQSYFNPKNLVKLDMRDSKVRELWSGIPYLDNMKTIDLSGSKDLASLPDISRAPNLDILRLNCCKSLTEIPSSIGYLPKLRSLELFLCTSLTEIPSSIGYLPKLRSLELDSCSSLTEIPSSIGYLPNLRSLNLCFCTSLTEIPSSIGSLLNLRSLRLYCCRSLSEIPSSIRYLTELRHLDLGACISLTEIPSSIGCLRKLRRLQLCHCRSLTEIPSSIGYLPKLRNLDLWDCTSLTELPSSISYPPKLLNLLLLRCENLTTIPDWRGSKSLRAITLSGCFKLRVLPRFPSDLQSIRLDQCRSLCEIPSSYEYPNKLVLLSFRDCKSLTSIPDYGGLKCLTTLEIHGCSQVQMLSEFPDNIEKLVLANIPIEELPSSLENLCRLRELFLIDCSRLKSLPSSGCKWKPLTTLFLNNCSKIDKLPDAIGTLKSLKKIRANGTALREVFPSLIGLDNLSTLSLRDCGITEIPDSLGWFTSLRELYLDNNNFESIPSSIMNLTELRKLSISYCKKLKVLTKLPWADIIAADCISLQEIPSPFFHDDVFSPNKFVCSGMVVDLTNCFKLDRKSLNKFVEDRLLEIKDLEASNKNDLYQVSAIYPLPITIQYPDGEIPTWFEYQNNGSDIDVNLPPDWFNFNYLCVALCIVVAPNSQYVDHGIDEFVKYDCTMKYKDGDRIVIVHPCHGPDFAFGHVGMSRSNHVAIALGFSFHRKHYGNQLSFQFFLNKGDGYLRLKQGQIVEGVNVEKCGVHLMYGVNKIEVEDEPHLEVSSEEDEPHLELPSEEDEPYLEVSSEEDEPRPSEEDEPHLEVSNEEDELRPIRFKHI